MGLKFLKRARIYARRLSFPVGLPENLSRAEKMFADGRGSFVYRFGAFAGFGGDKTKALCVLKEFG
jgi:hypothetical protein